MTLNYTRFHKKNYSFDMEIYFVLTLSIRNKCINAYLGIDQNIINYSCSNWALDKHKVPTKYVGLIKDMYNNVVTRVRTSDGDTDDFPIRIGLHQGSALSPYLFALVMDEVTRDIQGDIPWCMLFVDDVVLVDESRTGTGVVAGDFGVQRF